VSSDPILERIDAAIEKMRLRGEEVRAIYLTASDHDRFDREMCAKVKREQGLKRYKASFLSYGEHQLRRGTVSRLYSTVGTEVAVPVRLSHRVRLDEAA
jgi:hypothetical protein